MSRTEYMRELDALLQGISKEVREEAMQYYNVTNLSESGGKQPPKKKS